MFQVSFDPHRQIEVFRTRNGPFQGADGPLTSPLRLQRQNTWFCFPDAPRLHQTCHGPCLDQPPCDAHPSFRGRRASVPDTIDYQSLEPITTGNNNGALQRWVCLANHLQLLAQLTKSRTERRQATCQDPRQRPLFPRKLLDRRRGGLSQEMQAIRLAVWLAVRGGHPAKQVAFSCLRLAYQKK